MLWGMCSQTPPGYPRILLAWHCGESRAGLLWTFAKKKETKMKLIGQSLPTVFPQGEGSSNKRKWVLFTENLWWLHIINLIHSDVIVLFSSLVEARSKKIELGDEVIHVKCEVGTPKLEQIQSILRNPELDQSIPKLSQHDTRSKSSKTSRSPRVLKIEHVILWYEIEEHVFWSNVSIFVLKTFES